MITDASFAQMTGVVERLEQHRSIPGNRGRCVCGAGFPCEPWLDAERVIRVSGYILTAPIDHPQRALIDYVNWLDDEIRRRGGGQSPRVDVPTGELRDRLKAAAAELAAAVEPSTIPAAERVAGKGSIRMKQGVWIKATASDNSGGNCVQVRAMEGAVAVRDSKNPETPPLAFSTAEWDAFLDGAKNGEFDQ